MSACPDTTAARYKLRFALVEYGVASKCKELAFFVQLGFEFVAIDLRIMYDIRRTVKMRRPKPKALADAGADFFKCRTTSETVRESAFLLLVQRSNAPRMNSTGLQSYFVQRGQRRPYQT